MAHFNTQVASLSPGALVFGPGDLNNSASNDGVSRLYARNIVGSVRDVVINSAKACSHGFDHDVAVSIPAGETRIIGPFPVDRFGVGLGFTITQGSGVEFAVVR